MFSAEESNMNKVLDYQSRIDRFNSFWYRKETDRPTVGFQIGSPFVARRLDAGNRLLAENKLITHDMINVDEFIESYEKNYETSLLVDQDSYWTAEPYNGIPWIEAIVGCPIIGSKASFRSIGYIKEINELDRIILCESNPWYQKYFEFIEVLIKESNGRYPIGQPILRGISDIIGAVIGQENLIYAVYDYPDKIKKFAHRLAGFFAKLIKRQEDMIPEFLDGYSIGFYNIWAPGKCMWFQDDLSCLFSPDLYEKNIMQVNKMVSKTYKYNVLHLHPASFHLLNDFIAMENLKVIQINRDVGGLSIKDMLPALRKVQESKCLIIRGIMDKEDIDEALNNLSFRGLHLYQITETVDEARFWRDYIIENSIEINS